MRSIKVDISPQKGFKGQGPKKSDYQYGSYNSLSLEEAVRPAKPIIRGGISGDKSTYFRYTFIRPSPYNPGSNVFMDDVPTVSYNPNYSKFKPRNWLEGKCRKSAAIETPEKFPERCPAPR
jgi:hypothetical protein